MTPSKFKRWSVYEFTYAYLPRGPIYDWSHPEYASAFYEQLQPF